MDDPGLRSRSIVMLVVGAALLIGQVILFGSTNGWWAATTVVSTVYLMVSGVLGVVVSGRPVQDKGAAAPGLLRWAYASPVCPVLLTLSMVFAPGPAMRFLTIVSVSAALVSATLVVLTVFRITPEQT